MSPGMAVLKLCLDWLPPSLDLLTRGLVHDNILFITWCLNLSIKSTVPLGFRLKYLNTFLDGLNGIL